MTHRFLATVFSDGVKNAQETQGSRAAYSRFDAPTAPDILTGEEATFIGERDSFYLATVTQDGWPYIQHRGGSPGFMKMLDGRTLAFADFRGNRQYVSLGNVSTDDRVALFFMDYANRRRLKLLGRMRAEDIGEGSDLAEALIEPGYKAKVEHALVIAVEAFDWNCPQHITPRYTLAEVTPAIDALKARILELELQVERAGGSPT